MLTGLHFFFDLVVLFGTVKRHTFLPRISFFLRRFSRFRLYYEFTDITLRVYDDWRWSVHNLLYTNSGRMLQVKPCNTSVYITLYLYIHRTVWEDGILAFIFSEVLNFQQAKVNLPKTLGKTRLFAVMSIRMNQTRPCVQGQERACERVLLNPCPHFWLAVRDGSMP